MTTDDIIAVLSVGMCHGADKIAECPTCARKRAAIAEVRTGREQLLAALAGIAERDAEIERLHERVAAMKLRALAAHEAIWRAMNGRPSDAVRALMDDGEVHEAVHAIIAVETENVSAPEEWRAHVERQDRRIEALEAERVELHAEADRWRDVARKLGKEIGALRAERDREERDAAELMDERDHLERQIEDIYHTLGGTEEWSNCCDLGDEAEEMAGDMRAELARLRARDERTARVIEAALRWRRYGSDRVLLDALAALDDATNAAEIEAAHDLGAACGASVEERAGESAESEPCPDHGTDQIGETRQWCTYCQRYLIATGYGDLVSDEAKAALSMPPELAEAELRAISEAERAEEESER